MLLASPSITRCLGVHAGPVSNPRKAAGKNYSPNSIIPDVAAETVDLTQMPSQMYAFSFLD